MTWMIWKNKKYIYIYIQRKREIQCEYGWTVIDLLSKIEERERYQEKETERE